MPREFLRGLAGDDRSDHDQPRGFVAVRGSSETTTTVAAAARTIPGSASISDLPEDDADLAVAELHAFLRAPDADGQPAERVFGPSEAVDSVAAHHVAAGGTSEVEMDLNAHRLTEAATPPPGPGSIERLGPRHLDRLELWFRQFAEETGVPGGATPRARIEAQLDAGEIFGWRVGRDLVATARQCRDTPETRTIAMVWTPREHRRRGHASRLIAALAARIIADGRTPVLFTNADDPAVRVFYDRLGFRPQGAWRVRRFA
jgi:GNAT superfamily N-acetyltransferase